MATMETFGPERQPAARLLSDDTTISLSEDDDGTGVAPTTNIGGNCR